MFDILDQNEDMSKNLKELGVNLISDIRMDSMREASIVAEGHKTPDLIKSTYAAVVSRETVRIAFTYDALNGMNVLAADIWNSYLTAPTSEGFPIVSDSKFGTEFVGWKAIV